MRQVFLLGTVMIFAAATPAGAQDFLGPLEELVDGIAAPAEPVAIEESETVDTPPLPRPRPEEAVEAEVEAEPEVAAEPEPERVYQTACPALLDGRVVGQMLPPISDGVCQARSPLEITAVAVAGRTVPLSSPVTVECGTAEAFVDWVGEVDRAAGIAEVLTGTSYMCRNRVGDGDGFVSEHGFANAIDVLGFTLSDGTGISVEADWDAATSPAGKLLRQAHGAACGRFTTVLGPEANAEHADHFHLDLGCHGQSCTARICE
jgi:hypothetical protein